MRLLRSTLTSSLVLKATSLILGFLLWSTVSDLFTHSVWLQVPICFYNTGSETIKAPEAMSVELTGKRSYIRRIQKETVAVHIDAHTLKPGRNHLTITRDNLLMPPEITVTTVIPHKLIVHLTPGESS